MKYCGLACQPTEFYLTVFYVHLDCSGRLGGPSHRKECMSILRIDATIIESVDLGGVSGTSKQLPHRPLLSLSRQQRGENI